MSVNIATMGMFRDCCRGQIVGGGAPPYRQNRDSMKPTAIVTDVEIKTKRSLEDYLDKIKVKLIDFDE